MSRRWPMRLGGQLDASHSLAAHLALGHLDAAFVTDHTAVLHPLELPTETLPVHRGAKDPGAEKAISFGLEGAIVDGFRLRHLPVRPGSDLLRAGQRDPYGFEVVDGARPIRKGRALAQGSDSLGCQAHFSPPLRSCTSRHRLWSSRTRTLKDSGRPGSTVVSPLTKAS